MPALLKHRWLRALCLLGLALTMTPAPAWSTTTAAGTPLLRVVIMRHGVRAPTSSPSELAPFAMQPWAAWPVAPGMLTAHGMQGMTALGNRYRKMLDEAGLWSGRCDSLDQVVVIADSTPRNRASGAALSKGLAPACKSHYLALAQDQSNPLFHFGEKDGGKDDDATAASLPSDWPPAALAELQEVLLACHGDTCTENAKASGHKLLIDPSRPDNDAARAKALKSAGRLSENLMLEYAQGFPQAQVAWGHGDAATIGRLITLHNLQFALSKKSMPAAAQAGSNLVAHVLATLQQAAGIAPVVTPLAGKQAKVVLLVGHDTNLANVAGVLGLDWHDERQPDDYPPGGALVFDLLEEHGQYAVRVSSLMPTLEALRHADFGPKEALLEHALNLQPCPSQPTCPLVKVSEWLANRLDPQHIEQGMPALPANAP